MHKAITHKPFDRTTYGDVRPKPVDWKTRAALEAAERRLGYRLTVVQGSYNPGGVRQSGGTHDGGGVVDLLAWDWQRKVRVLRSIGFAAWYRPAISGLWGAHIHAVLIDHGKLSSSAAAQVASYRAGRDGLKGNRVDTFWRPSPIPVFDYPPLVEEAPPDAEPSRRRSSPRHRRGRPVRRTRPSATSTGSTPATTKAGGSTSRRPAPTACSGGTSRRPRARRSWTRRTPAGCGRRARPGCPSGPTTSPGPTAVMRPRRPGSSSRRPTSGPATCCRCSTSSRARDSAPSELTAWTGTWVRTVTRHLAGLGLKGRPIIYTPFNLEKGFGCFCWVARYSNDFRAPVVPRPWQRAVIWQHSNGRYGPVKNVAGFGPVDVNAVHPDVPLAALRVRRAERPKAPQPGGGNPPPVVEPDLPGAGPADPGRTDMQEVRSALVAAARSIEAAVDRLPER